MHIIYQNKINHMANRLNILMGIGCFLCVSVTVIGQNDRIPAKQQDEVKLIEVKSKQQKALNQATPEKNAKEIWWEENQVYTVVEDMPQYPGGTEAMYKFIGEHLVYPAEAKAAGKEGLVVLSFIVEKDGSIHDIEILKDGVGFGAAEAASKVVSSMPVWSPGKQDGKPVRVKITSPFKFILPK